MDSDGEVELRVNEAYAAKYLERKRYEELQNLKNLSDESDESDDETEDEDGEQLTKELDKDISRTIKLIRHKDPSIYDSNIAFFEKNDDDEEEEEDERAKKKAKKQKPLYYKDLVRQQVLAGNVDSDESDEETPVTSYADEQKKLKGDFLKSVEMEDEDEEDLDGGLFSVRQKSKDELEKEDDEFKSFKEANPDAADELNADAFLERFMKTEAWKDKRKAPSYEEIVGTDKVDDEEDADELDKADAFEHSYNFRFEEEGGGQIQTFSRVVEDSMRRKDDKRKKEREERKARKAIERQKKEDELRRLKNLRQAEIQSKIDKIMALMGPSKKTLTVDDVDGAFDPEEHDRRMAEVFNDDYYEEDENGKPVWEDDDEVFGKLPEEDEGDEDEAEPAATENDEEQDENETQVDDEPMDNEEENNADEEKDDEIKENMTEEEMKAMKQKYLDELYALDYEDLIGDMPCRFKYRTVEKNSYGLSTMDILDADDKELKAVVSLKRLAPFVDREYEVNRRKVQSLRKQIKAKKKQKKNAEEPAEQPTEAPEEARAEATDDNASDEKKKSRKRKRKKASTAEAPEAPPAEEEPEAAKASEPSKKKRKQKKKKVPEAASGLTASRLESYRLKPLK